MRRIQQQLLFVLLAAISVSTLSILLIGNAVHSAEGFVLADSHKALHAALGELRQQYDYRINSDSSWSALPLTAQDISLRGISQAVLRSYPGVEGGFSPAAGVLLGYSYPTHGSGGTKVDVPEAERPEIQTVIQKSRKSGRAESVLRGSRDLVVIEAAARNGEVCWAMKRISGITDPGEKRRNTLLIGLVLAALVSVVGTLGTVIGLRRGIAELENGLATLETNFDFQLATANGELGQISRSINRLAKTRRTLEAEVRREDRLRAMGRLSANIAHEIRNPLNGIRLSIQVLKRRLPRNEVRQEDLDLVMEEVDRLNAMLSGLLTFPEAPKARLEKQPVLPIVERCVRLMQGQARERGIAIELQSDDTECRAQVDAQQLTQVMTNLLLNAIAAISTKGCIEIKVRREGECVSIEVADTGPGVAAEQREHLFEPFHTTRSGGSGLGLAVSRELVQGMGGTLTYMDGTPGAKFVVNLPARERTAA